MLSRRPAIWRLPLIIIGMMVLMVAGAITLAQGQGPVVPRGIKDAERWIRIFEDPDRERWQKPSEVLKRLKLRSGQVVADIGAGTGYFTRRFAKIVGPTGKALGLDIDPVMVSYMRRDAKRLGLKNYVARQVRAEDPGLPPHSVDLIFLCNTYHHIAHRVDYFARLIGSLKEGGRLVIIDFYKRSLPVGPPVERKVAKATVIRELEEAGYRLVRSLDFLPYQYFLEFQVRRP